MGWPDDWNMDRGHRTKRAFGEPEAVRYMTFSCERQLPLFHRAATRDAFVVLLLAAAAAGELVLHAWVVMPEHVHVLASPGTFSVAGALARVKSRFARATLALWEVERPGVLASLTRSDGRRRFWLAGGGFNRPMANAAACWARARYTHANPVRRGLVERPRHYKWSSAWDGVERE